MTSSITSRSARFAFASLLATTVLGAGGFACSSGGSDDASAAADDPTIPSRDDAGTKKAPSVGGDAITGELTDALGVFVAPGGQHAASGTHDHPLASIQDAIDLAKTVGKRVYVCTGDFHEAITVADSISIIGGLDCTENVWHVGAAHSRIDSPTSPAIRATNITSPTRLENLDVFAPNATAPSGSSIGLIADHAGALTIASSKITAGNGAKGDDGTDGIQLANAPTANGSAGWDMRSCTAGGCNHDGLRPTFWARPPRGQQGENVCVGAPGFVGASGGFGGNGGLYQVELSGPTTIVNYYLDNSVYKFELGDHTHTSAPGVDGTDGASASSTPSISKDGFAPANGTAGKDGAPGSGGAGGDGFSSTTGDQHVGDVWTGWSGAGGGAGGCPGLAGTAGQGGGASIAAVLIDSAITFDAAELVSSKGGAGGLGSFGSAPTAGGAPGVNTKPSEIPSRSAQPGGHGGAAGVSGNGANGPSVGIAYSGAKPTVSADTKVTPGAAAPAIEARSRTTLAGTKTIPAAPAGTSKDILAF